MRLPQMINGTHVEIFTIHIMLKLVVLPTS